MKYNVYFCLITCCLMFLTGCSEDGNYQTVVSRFDIVQSDNIDLPAEGGVATVEFAAEGVTVKAEVDADWCRIEETTANKVTVSVDVNEGYTSRSATLVLTDGETIRQVAILQSGAVWIYDREETTIYVNEVLNNVIVKMSGTFPLELSIPKEVAGWLTGSLTDEGIKLRVQKNTTGQRRTASFTVRMKDRTAEYTVVQYVVDDLLGTWTGDMLMSGIGDDTTLQLSGSSITKTDVDDQYLLSLPVGALEKGASLDLTATYKDGKFTIKTPQNQEIMIEGLYSSIISGSADGLALEGNIVLTPTTHKGVVTYTYNTGFYLCLGFFTGRIPTVQNYSGNIVVFPKLSIRKSLK